MSDVLDLKGLNCPLPVLKTAKAMTSLASGARLVVEATDPMSAIDIPHFCRQKGHTLISVERGEVFRFTIEKG